MKVIYCLSLIFLIWKSTHANDPKLEKLYLERAEAQQQISSKLLKLANSTNDPSTLDKKRAELELTEIAPIQQKIDQHLSEKKKESYQSFIPKPFQPSEEDSDGDSESKSSRSRISSNKVSSKKPSETPPVESKITKEIPNKEVLNPEPLDASQIPEEMVFQKKPKPPLKHSAHKEPIKEAIKKTYLIEEVQNSSEDEQLYQKKK